MDLTPSISQSKIREIHTFEVFTFLTFLLLHSDFFIIIVLYISNALIIFQRFEATHIFFKNSYRLFFHIFITKILKSQ